MVTIFYRTASQTIVSQGFQNAFITNEVIKPFWSALHLHGLATVSGPRSCIRPGAVRPARKESNRMDVSFQTVVAAREGFEPTGPLGPSVFKTDAIDLSAISP